MPLENDEYGVRFIILLTKAWFIFFFFYLSKISFNTSIYVKKNVIGDHWENSILGFVALSPQGSEIIQLSVFTIALLKDTGFYEDVNENLSFPITWGKSKGCLFVTNTI